MKKLIEAKVYMAASGMMRQLELGMTDMELHSNYDPNGDVTPFEIHREISIKTNILEPLPENHFLCAFNENLCLRLSILLCMFLDFN